MDIVNHYNTSQKEDTCSKNKGKIYITIVKNHNAGIVGKCKIVGLGDVFKHVLKKVGIIEYKNIVR